MRWDADTIERVKEASDLVDVIGRHVPLKRAGSSYKAVCPFHQEKTPSFMVNPARQIFHCFGCETGGDVVRFVMLYEGLPFTDAIRKLADAAGIQLPEKTAGTGISGDDRDLMYRANRVAAQYFANVLLKEEEGRKARKYLSDRGIHSDVSKAFGMGWAPAGRRSLPERLKSGGIPQKTVLDAGLAIEGDGDKEPGGRFRSRVMFPIRDLSGRVLGFGGRLLDDGQPKYINTSETPIYRKGDALFGMDVAAPYIREHKEAILVEGYLDVIALNQAGIGNVVGVLGTSLTAEQARKVKRLTNACVLMFDTDEAGRKATLRSGTILLEEGFHCRVAEVERGEDPDSFVRKRGADALRDRIRTAPTLITYVMEDAKRMNPGQEIGSRIQVIDAIIPYLAKIKDRARLGAYLKEIGDDLRIEQHDLRARLASERGSRQVLDGNKPAVGRTSKREDLLVHIMIRTPSSIPRVKRALRPHDFTGPGIPELVEKIFSGADVGRLMDAVDVDDEMKNKLSRWAIEDPPEGVDRALDGCLREFSKSGLMKRIREIRLQWVEAVEKGEERRFQELSRELEKMQTELDELKSGKYTFIDIDTGRDG